MWRLLFRTVIVCIGLVLLLVASQRVTEQIARPKAALRLQARGLTHDGREIRWTLSVDKERLMDLDGRPVQDLDAVRATIVSVLPKGSLTIEAQALTSLDDEQIAAAVRKLSEDKEHPQLPLARTPGLIGRLQQFWHDGGQFGKQSPEEFQQALAAYDPDSAEVAAAQAAVAKVKARLASLKQSEAAGEAAGKKLKDPDQGLAKVKPSGGEFDALSQDQIQDKLGDVRKQIRDLEANGVKQAMLELTKPVGKDQPKLAAAKVLGLVGDLNQLDKDGAAIGSMPARELEAKLAALKPTPEELAALYYATGLLARQWTFTIAGEKTAIDGRPATVQDLEARVARYAILLGAGQQGTQAATIDDVLQAAREGKLVAPSRPYTSFPGRMTYDQARPKDEGPGMLPPRAEKPDFVITKFADAPALHDKALQEKLRIREYVDGSEPGDDDWDNLPPVAERLPKNPAVMVGPDGEGPNRVGRYGGKWVRASASDGDLRTKIGYPGFVRFDPKGDLQPNYAYKWSVTDNNHVFTFWLRPGHRWSDGALWSAHDIAWVCNVLIGSDYWSDASDWMQETDGSLLLYPDDVKDWPALAQRILSQADSEKPSLGRQIAKVIEAEIPAAVTKLVDSQTLAESKVAALVADLKKRGPDVFKLGSIPLDQLQQELAVHNLTLQEAEAVQGLLGELKLIKLRPMLEAITPTSLPDDLTQAKIASILNKSFESPLFYDPAAWQDVDLTSEYQALLAKGPSTLAPMELQRLEFLITRNDLQRRIGLSAEYAELLKKKEAGSLTDSERDSYKTLSDSDKWLRLGVGDINMEKEAQLLKKFNLLMFRAACADLVAPPVRERVKVEAVDDYTVRFTFKKPAAFFLEKTATFMYYRGIFQSSLHFNGKMHPDGTCLLAIEDILDWEGFLKKVRQQGEADQPSPGKQLWTLLGEEIKARFREEPPGDDPKDAWKQSIIDELNRILENERGFYTAEAWKDVDLKAELQKLQDVGFTRLTDPRQKRRYLVLLQVEDQLLRGPAALPATGQDDKSNALLLFNVAMFRAAFSAKVTDFIKSDSDKIDAKARNKASLVACDRENALDLVAQNDSLKFDTWVDKLRAVGTKLRTRMHTPELTPWRIVTDPIELKSVAIRNPYYYAVDAEGNQLPYLDVFINEAQSQKAVRMLKLTSGNVSFDCRDLFFEDYTVLKQGEERGGYKIYLWPNDFCGELTFYFPLARKEKELQKLEADSRFRKAMSYALNRQEIIDVVYKGVGKPAQWSVPKGSKFYNEKHATMAVDYRPELANRILDEMGLDQRNAEGTRLLWSGEPMNLDVVTTPERPLSAVEMACNYWRAIGVNCQMKMQNQAYINNAIAIGILDIGVHKEGGNYFGPVYAGGFAPVHPAESNWGSKWVEWLRTGGASGWEPPEYIKELDVQWSKVVQSPTEADLIRNWKEMSDTTADWLPWIGVMTSPGIPVYVKNGFKNVPRISLAGWMAHEPGNNCPEVFYWEKEQD